MTVRDSAASPPPQPSLTRGEGANPLAPSPLMGEGGGGGDLRLQPNYAHSFSKKILFGGAAGLALACVSCGNGLYPVSGKVTYQGAPAAGATVFLRRQGTNPMSDPMIMGIVADDGSFTLVTGSLGKGAPPGQYDVLVEWKKPAGQGRPQQRSDKLNGRFADPNHPRLHVVIKPQRNDLAPFDLTDD